MFDRSFLPPADFEFVVIADTHTMIDPGGQPLEFESRRRQTARAEAALRQVATLQSPLVIHLGDLVQTFPERPDFFQAMGEAIAQLKRCGVQPRFVAGNHDVGDKPDPTMPTAWVTDEALAAHHAQFGRSWSSWDQGGLHFVVLNSQIMNGPLAAAREQQRWLEADLQANRGRLTVVLLHLPPFLADRHEPSLGHYDNMAEPARSWLLGLLDHYHVEMLLAAHVHFAFYDRLGSARYFVVPSVAFTRPGFSELFSSGPPPEQGRDDVAKLGFHLVRSQAEGLRVHFVRTGGATALPDAPALHPRLVTRTSPDLPASPLGLHLVQPLAQQGQVPSAWPSLVRQPVRNDYPLLTAVELGVRYVRVPASDLDDRLQRERLHLLRGEGVHIIGVWPWSDDLDWAGEVTRLRGQIDAAEAQVLGSPWPSDACLRQITAVRRAMDVPLGLSCAVPGHRVVGKQHSRTQIGYRPDDLAELDVRLAAAGVGMERVLCRLDPGESMLDDMARCAELAAAFGAIGGVDWLVTLPHDERSQIQLAAQAFMAAAGLAETRLFFEPFVDLDRTMDVAFGLLDRLCNPRSVFHVLRHLNTLLYAEPRAWQPLPSPHLEGVTAVGLAGGEGVAWLLLPNAGPATLDWTGLPSAGADQPVRCFGLMTGSSRILAIGDPRPPVVDEASLLLSA